MKAELAKFEFGQSGIGESGIGKSGKKESGIRENGRNYFICYSPPIISFVVLIEGIFLYYLYNYEEV